MDKAILRNGEGRVRRDRTTLSNNGGDTARWHHLANVGQLRLDGLEAELEARFGSKGNRKAGKTKVNLVRYADDFVITGVRKNCWKTRSDSVEAFLATGAGTLAREDQDQHVTEGFDFLVRREEARAGDHHQTARRTSKPSRPR